MTLGVLRGTPGSFLPFTGFQTHTERGMTAKIAAVYNKNEDIRTEKRILLGRDNRP